MSTAEEAGGAEQLPCLRARRWSLLAQGQMTSLSDCEVLGTSRPDLCPQDALAFPNDAGGFIDGGWKSAPTLPQHYTHFIPSELQDDADVIALRDGTKWHQQRERSPPLYDLDSPRDSLHFAGAAICSGVT